MNLRDGPRLGMLGSALLFLGFLIALLVGIWATVLVLTALSPYISSNALASNSVNATQIQQLSETEAVQLAGDVLIPGILFLVLSLIGSALIGLALVAFGKNYNDVKMVRYGYYGAIAMAVGFAVQLIPVLISSVISEIIVIAGAVLLALAFKMLSERESYKNLTYYGYGLIAAAVLQLLLSPLGIIAFIIVAMLLFVAFRNLGKTVKPEENPFDTNPGAVVKTPRQPAKKKK